MPSSGHARSGTRAPTGHPTVQAAFCALIGLHGPACAGPRALLDRSGSAQQSVDIGVAALNSSLAVLLRSPPFCLAVHAVRPRRRHSGHESSQTGHSSDLSLVGHPRQERLWGRRVKTTGRAKFSDARHIDCLKLAKATSAPTARGPCVNHHQQRPPKSAVRW